MSDKNEYMQCNFQKTFKDGSVGCRLKIEIIQGQIGFQFCDEEKCRLAGIESDVKDIYKLLMDEYKIDVLNRDNLREKHGLKKRKQP